MSSNNNNNNLNNLKINFKIRIKNLILQLQRMIIRILKELGKYASMMRKYKKMPKRKVIYKGKERE